MTRILCAVLLSITCAAAQSSTTGKVVGTVTDASGAIVPKAEVQLVNTDTNAAASSITDDSGGYVFPSVQPGPYKITVKMTGFRTETISNLVVEVDKTSNLGIKLEVGGATDVVEVTAGAVAALQTTDAQIGN